MNKEDIEKAIERMTGVYNKNVHTFVEELGIVLNYIKQLEQERDKYKFNAEKLEKIILELYEENKRLLNHLAIDKIKELEDRSVNND